MFASQVQESVIARMSNKEKRFKQELPRLDVDLKIDRSFIRMPGKIGADIKERVWNRMVVALEVILILC